ncbi:MAG: sel1 repeat family protein [Treponema sp.]|nr:sel1 repeat family protein [Treponema sp.]
MTTYSLNEEKNVPIDEEKAFYYARKGALKNDALCQFYQGQYYLEGGDSLNNDIEAFLCFEKSAKKGEPKAFEGLAKCYYYGLGIQQDFIKAREYLIKTLEYGIPNNPYEDFGSANYLLGQCYENGLGYEKNIDKARYYYKESAKYHYENALDAIKERI